MTRVDEGRKYSILLAKNMKARTVVGRGGRARYVTPDLSCCYHYTGREREINVNTITKKRDEEKNKPKKELWRF